MKKIFILFVVFCCTASICYAQSIAIEFQENSKFRGIVGSAHYTGEAIEVVTFTKLDGKVIPFAWIYRIIEKISKREAIYHIKCQNQLGAVCSGTLDLSDEFNPKINLIFDIGGSMTNISKEGINFQTKYLPKVDLGK